MQMYPRNMRNASKCAAYKFSQSSAKRTKFKSTLRQQEGVEGMAKHTPVLNKGHLICERSMWHLKRLLPCGKSKTRHAERNYTRSLKRTKTTCQYAICEVLLPPTSVLMILPVAVSLYWWTHSMCLKTNQTSTYHSRSQQEANPLPHLALRSWISAK